MLRGSKALAMVILGAVVAACDLGSAGSPVDDGSTQPAPPTVPGAAPAPAPEELGPSTPAAMGLRRLSNTELVLSVGDLLGVPAASALANLPASPTPFDNDYTKMMPSALFVETLDAGVTTLARAALADPLTRDALVGCTPSGPDDATCFGLFLKTFGRLALRRPLTDAEALELAAPMLEIATRKGDFYFAVEIAIRSLLQDAEFVFRVERGVAVAGQSGVFELSQHELATRLAFTLWGRTPPAWLLDLADAGKLGTAGELLQAAEQLRADPKAATLTARYVAMWLNYTRPPVDALEASMLAETEALVARTLASKDATELFTSTDTYVNAQLAFHYGLTPPPEGFGPTGWAWVSYAGTERRGIFGHGLLLRNGAKFNDTSPVGRGKWISERLLCRPIGPPPVGVNVDVAPASVGGSRCKKDRYAAHRTNPTCAGCHESLDGIGFALERFGPHGEARTVEPDAPECTIDSVGVLAGTPIVGPEGLSAAVASSAELEECMVRQAFRFTYGRNEDANDEPRIYEVIEAFKAGGHQVADLALTFVTHPTFRFRREEP